MNDVIIETILNTPSLYRLLIPDGINAYGIMLGGSRFFGLENEDSDYDLNIIVSSEDYAKLEKKHSERPSIYINNIHIHWYYCPVDFKFFNFSFGSYMGLYWWNAAFIQGITRESFIRILDESGITKFLNKLEANKTLLFMLLRDAYRFGYLKLPKDETILRFIWKKSYLPLYIAFMLSNTDSSKKDVIRKIKRATANIEQIDDQSNTASLAQKLSDEDVQFIIDMFNVLIEKTNF